MESLATMEIQTLCRSLKKRLKKILKLPFVMAAELLKELCYL